MENLTYVRDSRNGREAAVINAVARFQLGEVGVVYRSDLRDGEWLPYRPIAMSVANRTEFYEHMITVALGWYDLSGEGAKVLAFIPEFFPGRSVEIARRKVADDFPGLADRLEGQTSPAIGR